MKRSVVAILTVAGLSACFDDPTSALRSGPAAAVLDRSAVLVVNGDSARIEARVTDAQGNPLPISSPSWTSDDPTIATVTPAETQAGGVVTAAYIKAVNGFGAVTFVRFSSRGVGDSIRVTSLPGALPAASAVVSGTATADTSAGTAFTAGDTVTVNAPNLMQFDALASAVHFGNQNAYVLSRTATAIKVMARGPHRGRVVVTNVTVAGYPALGTPDLTLDSLITADVLDVARVRFRGTVAVSAGILMTLTAPAGLTFSTTAGSLASVKFGPDAGTVISLTAAQLVVSSPVNYTGGVTVRNVIVGGVRLDSVLTTSNSTIQRATFPGTVATTGTDILDTITVTAGAGAALSTGATPSNVVSGGLNAFVISRSAAQLVVVPQAAGVITITNVDVNGTVFPSLPPTTAVTVGTATGETGEPLNDLQSSSPTLAPTGTFQSLYGTLTPGSDVDDFFRIVIATPMRIEAFGAFRGSGSGGVGNPDVDFFVIRDVNSNNIINGADICDEFGGSFAEADCTGATAVQPEHEITQVLPVGTYFIYVNLFLAGGLTAPIAYEMQFRVTP